MRRPILLTGALSACGLAGTTAATGPHWLAAVSIVGALVLFVAWVRGIEQGSAS